MVVAYHAGLPGLSAGYLGVDLFFVISGFLITGIITRGMDNGGFSFREFYYRRAKRLLPAAYVVLAVVVAVAPFVLTDAELADLNAQVVGSLTFIANWVLWQQSGYFEGAAEMKPLLHFWSLAVEEQYYFVMPLLFVVVPRKIWTTVVAVIVVLSFLLSVYAAPLSPDFAFYLPFTRMWELGIGSLGALSTRQVTRNAWLPLARLPAIAVLAYIPFQPTGFSHPGIDALFVCLSTLVIILGCNGSPLERGLIVRVFAKVGDISYSLYLVHWPVLVFTRSAYLGSAPAEAIVAAVISSVALSWLLYRYVEDPMRSILTLRPQSMIVGLCLCSATLLIAPSAIASRTDSGEDFSYIRRHNYGIARECAASPRYPFTGTISDACRTKADAKVLIWGDSYAMAWTGGLVEPLRDLGVEQATKSACDPLLGMARFSPAANQRYNSDFAKECIEFNDRVLTYVTQRDDIGIVVLAGRLQTILSRSNEMLVQSETGHYQTQATSEALAAKGLSRLITAVQATGKRVAVLSPPPADGSEIGDCLERVWKGKITLGRPNGCDLRLSDVHRYQAATNSLLDAVGKGTGVPILSATHSLCSAEWCRTEINGVLLYRDSGHLSVEGAKYVVEHAGIARQIRSLQRR